MSVSSPIRKSGPYNGNGATVAFPFTFKVFKPSEVVVTRTDTKGVEVVLTITADYTVTLNANQDGNPGGTITMLTAPVVGFNITLGSNVEALQDLTLTNQGGFYPKVINDALDRITIVAQQMLNKIGGTLKVGFADGNIGNLPSKGMRSDMGLGFDTNGDPIAVPLSNLVNAIPLGEKGSALGVATLDANQEVIQPQSGAAAEIAAGRTASVKRSDGSWGVRVPNLPNNTNLQLWVDSISTGTYSVFMTVAQNGLPAGFWYIEVMRHTIDNVNSQFRYMRATTLDRFVSASRILHCNSVNGVWSSWVALEKKIASSVQATAGTNNTAVMTPLRVKQVTGGRIIGRYASNFPGVGEFAMAGAVLTVINSTGFTKKSNTSILVVKTWGTSYVGDGNPAVVNIRAMVDGVVRADVCTYSTYDHGYVRWVAGYFSWSGEATLTKIPAGSHIIAIGHQQNGYTIYNRSSVVNEGRGFVIEEIEL